MIRGSLYLESDDLKNVGLRLTSGKYSTPEPYLLLDLKRTDLTIYLAPEDLPRIAGMLRLAAENMESLIGNTDEKAKPILHLVPKPLTSDSLASAA
jgi:hypothetical protein